MQISTGLPEPQIHSMPRLRQVLKGVQRVRGKEGRAPKPRLPITPDILRKLKAVWMREGSSRDCCCGRRPPPPSFCRSGEVVVESENSYDPNSHLSYRDLSVDNPQKPRMIAMMLCHSKTDQARRGVKVVMGWTGDDLCPVTTLLSYLAVRGNRPGPLFMHANGKPLTKAQFVAGVRSALTEAKLPATSYAGHSFRIGAATTAAAAGVEDSVIKTLGRWKSSAYLLYIRMDPRQLAAVSSSLANCRI